MRRTRRSSKPPTRRKRSRSRSKRRTTTRRKAPTHSSNATTPSEETEQWLDGFQRIEYGDEMADVKLGSFIRYIKADGCLCKGGTLVNNSYSRGFWMLRNNNINKTWSLQINPDYQYYIGCKKSVATSSTSTRCVSINTNSKTKTTTKSATKKASTAKTKNTKSRLEKFRMVTDQERQEADDLYQQVQAGEVTLMTRDELEFLIKDMERMRRELGE